MARATNDVQIFHRVNGLKFAKAIALLEPVQAKLIEQSLKIGVRAEAFQAPHTRTGGARITVEHGKRVDMFVSLVDSPGVNPGRTKKHNADALAIEAGTHRSKGIHALMKSIGRA